MEGSRKERDVNFSAAFGNIVTMKILRSLLTLLAGLLLVSCTPRQEVATPTAELPMVEGTAVVLATDTVAPPSTATQAVVVKDTPLPATATATSEGVEVGTAEVVNTVTQTVPFTEGHIVFFWNPSAMVSDPADGPGSSPAPNFYMAIPGATPGEWQVEMLLSERLPWDQATTLSPDKTKLALILLDDTNGNGRLDTGGPDQDTTNIYLFRPSDQTLTRLTDNEQSVYTLSWSPDSQKITYRQRENVFEASIDGSPVQLVTSVASLCTDFCSVERLAWSPDGRLLAIYAITGQGNALYIFNENAGQISLVGSTPVLEMLWWSANNRWLAFTQFGYSDLSVVNADTLERLELVMGENFTSVPAWSPDGQWLAYTRSRTALSMWNSNNQEVTEVIHAADVSAPVWSSSGSNLALGTQEDGQAKLLVVNASDGGVQELFETTEMEYVEVLSWSPDGQWLLYFAQQEEQLGLYVINRADGEAHLVMDMTGGGIPSSVVWLPSSQSHP